MRAYTCSRPRVGMAPKRKFYLSRHGCSAEHEAWASQTHRRRVPAFVNAVSFGPGTERARQHTVDYIASSAAGFYVLDTRLTTAMVVKMTYIWCIVVVAAFTRLAGSSP